MHNIFVINAGQEFGHSGGRFNNTVTQHTLDFFNEKGMETQVTHIAKGYDKEKEVEKFVWADVVIYHTPIWWFQVPHNFKKYIDEVFTAGHRKGIYRSDGRKLDNPAVNYGTGGMLHGKHYLLTTSWNAPATAFTLPSEFFQQKSVDEGPLFGFHRMNAFAGMDPFPSYHFHDIEKNAQVARDMASYQQHLQGIFGAQSGQKQ